MLFVVVHMTRRLTRLLAWVHKPHPSSVDGDSSNSSSLELDRSHLSVTCRVSHFFHIKTRHTHHGSGPHLFSSQVVQDRLHPSYSRHGPSTMMMKRALGIVFAALVMQICDARPAFVQRIPNGNGVNGVEALGHANPNGGGTLNLFGRAFDAAGFQWTTELCQTDSDGDGATNGEELGDPCCQWTQGTRLQASSAVTHPGVANPFTNDQLASLKCQELSTPPETPEPVAPAPSPVSDADDPSNAPSPQSVLPPLLPSGAPVTPPTPASPMTPSPVQSKKPAKVEKVDTSDAHRTSRFTMALVVGLCSVLFAM